MAKQGQFYDEVNDDLTSQFGDLNHQFVVSFELSGNSFGIDACQWIAENVLVNCVHLKKVNFSDIFTTRARDKLPASLKFLIDAIMDK